MFVEVKKKWCVEAQKYVVVFSFDDPTQAQRFIKPYLSGKNPPVFADLSGGGDITVTHSAGLHQYSEASIT